MAARCTLVVKVVPNAPRTQVAGWLDAALKVKVHAPATGGRANDALCRFVATSLDLPSLSVTVLRGHASRQKVLQIVGRDLDDVRARFKAPSS